MRYDCVKWICRDNLILSELNKEECTKRFMEYNFISKLSGTTALHDASKYGKAAIARFLIDKGADVHAKDRAGFTPLHVSES